MITIVDYGLGNVMAFANVYKTLNIPVTIAREPQQLSGAAKVILPGVGAFDHAMQLLNESGMRPELERLVLEQRVPVLGVCVGMQMVASGSEEGRLPGLGWIEGRVIRLDPNRLPHATHLPHMGWNDVRPVRNNPLFNGLENEARFYFLHSYYFHCGKQADVLAVARYGDEFCCAVGAGNVHGVQFHPEKSHRFGTRLLKNFAEL
ncbi:MAG TPA: imidazole glycerol phosphate synthase subunit HisH [Steroidobacteraceae bacterium]